MDKRFQVFQRMKINNSIKEFEMDNDDKKYIPSLRFPEFLNDGEWEIRKLSNIAIRKNKKNKLGSRLPI